VGDLKLDLVPIPNGGNLTSENESFATNKNKKQVFQTRQ
jgi:hypothetical protein